MNQSNKFEELKKLGELFDAGVLSQEEFEVEKARLIASGHISSTDSEPNNRGLYVPGTAPKPAELPGNQIATKASGTNLKKIVILITRVFLAINTVGISELVIFSVRKFRTKQQAKAF